jgi:hypothetical protein
MNTRNNLPRYWYPFSGPIKHEVVTSDICAYGATPAGITAAVQAAKLGKTVVLVECGNRIGGMTSSGLSATDIGNKHVIGGLARQFYKEAGAYYDQSEAWLFEPHVALDIFRKWIDQYDIRLFMDHRLLGVEKNINRIISMHTECGTVFRAGMYIDATYEGDLMSEAGVRYAVGREGDMVYDELFNGVHFGMEHHNFIRFVDPYKDEGNPRSGLLDGVAEREAGRPGEGDSLIQAYNFRLCITKDPKNKIPWPKPAEYNPRKYELLRRYMDNGVFDIFHLALPIPHDKADHNNWGAFNSDYIGGNYEWPDGDYEKREKIFQDHINYQMGLFYFCSHAPSVHRKIRNWTAEWGLAADEFTDTGNWPGQLYIREARRMISDYVITEHDSIGRYYPEDSVGMASYRMDSHNCKRIVKSGRALNEGNVEISPLSPFPIPFRAIRPRRDECGNLLVPVCVSASHIAFGAIRLEPVYMILGQSAGVAAALALEKKCAVQDISYSDLEKKLKVEGQILNESEVRPEKLIIT